VVVADAELRRLSFIPLLVVDEVGYIPFGTTGCRDPLRDARADRRTRTPAAGARR
jgi:hypothetical protein